MQKLKELQADLAPFLEDIQGIKGDPLELYEPISYILKLGGKRIRPALVLAAYKMYNDTYTEDVFKLAQAVEMFHNFTLMHDDIMDNAEVRRGKATVHKKWDEDIAILSGDLLQILVYKKLSEISNPTILPQFNAMAIELCEGQMKDMSFEKKEAVSNEAYIDMIRQKTAVLLGFALQSGAVLGGATEVQSQKLYDLGIQIGLSFQLIDDYLDSFGSQAAVGKRIGGDILEKKKTYLWNAMWAKLDENDKEGIVKAYALTEDETIEMIKDTMAITGAKDAIQKLALSYSERASELLRSLAYENDKTYVEEIVDFLSQRSF